MAKQVPEQKIKSRVMPARDTWDVIQSLFSPSPAFVEKKFQDHRYFSALAFAIYGTLGLALWIWDYVTDPISAQHAILLRLSYLGSFIIAGTFICFARFRIVAWAFLFGWLLAPILFVVMITRLRLGMMYGIGGFMFFQFGAVLCFQCFPLCRGMPNTRF